MIDCDDMELSKTVIMMLLLLGGLFIVALLVAVHSATSYKRKYK